MSTTDDCDILELHPITDAAGETVWMDLLGLDSSNPGGANHDVIRTRSGDLEWQTDSSRRNLSVLPRERMAGEDAWADIVRQLRDAEDGRDAQDVVMRPGGGMEVNEPGGQTRPLSRLPQEKMAAVNPKPSEADIAEIREIDPQRVEDWTPMLTGLLNGWKFRLRPDPGAMEFVFLAFRSPQDGNNFRIFVVKPDVDKEYGHRPHMIGVNIGGQKIPVICGPNGRAARTLTEARGHAGKWMIYTHRLVNMRVSPGFSA